MGADPPLPSVSSNRPPTPIPVIVAFIYPPPLRCGRPGRGGAGGLAGVGWGGGAVRVRCSRGPESFLLGPIWGLPSFGEFWSQRSRPPRARGRASAILKLFASFRPLKVLRPCTPRPRPTPFPREPFQGSELQPFPFEPPGWGDGLLFPFGKLFQGFFLADLLVTELFAMGKVEVNSGDISTGQVF